MLVSKDDLLRFTGNAAVVRFEVAEQPRPAMVSEGAVLFSRTSDAEPASLIALGPLDGVRTLVAEVVAERPDPWVTAQHITVEAANEVALESFDLHIGRWLAMGCRRGALVDAPDGPAPVVLDASRQDEVFGFLEANHTTQWTRPGLPDQTWLGLTDGQQLVAVGCLTSTEAGFGQLGGISVDRSARGTGLGRLITWHLTRLGHERSVEVVLGVDDDNAAARVLYTSLGFRDLHHWRSLRLAEDVPSSAC